MQSLYKQPIGVVSTVPARGGRVRDWQRWAPYAAVAWSLAYAALGGYWAVVGRGFPFSPKAMSDGMGPVVGRLGPGGAWIVVVLAGIPAAAVGIAMLRGVRSAALRLAVLTAGALLAVVLLLLMTDLHLLILLGYLPYAVLAHFTPEKGQAYRQAWTQWSTIHQVLCLIGGFLWLAATVSYGRRSAGACLSCGRRDGPEGWTSPASAARWGRIAVLVAMVAPVIYALTRYAWALGIPLGISPEALRRGQEQGIWTSGLFLATFGLAGATLMLGLVQRWGEVFPRSLRRIGLAGRRVPIALAVVPASIVSVLLIVGGITIWAGFGRLAAAAVASDQNLWIVVGPTLLFPVWGAALALATLGYYYRRRGRCGVCGRGAPASALQAANSAAPPAMGGEATLER
jgi:hypothetical protein